MDAFRCGVAGDGDVVDTRAADKARFDRKRVNVASAADQHVVGAVAYGQPSFFIDFAEVASGQPAITAAVTGYDLRAPDSNKVVRARREFIGAKWAANQAFAPQVGGRPARREEDQEFLHCQALAEAVLTIERLVYRLHS